MHDAHKVVLVTSDSIKQEIRRTPRVRTRRRLRAVLALFDELPLVSEEVHQPLLTGTLRSGLLYPPIVDHELLGGFLPDRFDARHLYQAIRHDVDYFVTRDVRTILSHRQRLNSDFGITACLPSELVAPLV
jgi:hypothetical protein